VSRAFEVLERVRQDQELFRVPSVTKEAPGSDKPTSGRVTVSDLDVSASEEVLRLVQCLFLATNGEGRSGPRQVVFCGIDEGDGSTLLCARVGRSLAEQVESQVCVVDANLRSLAPNLLFDLPLSGKECQAEHGTTPKFTQRVTDNLCVLSGESITTNGGTRTLDQLQALVKDLSGYFTYWVISTAPIGLFSDATLLGQMADGVVLVLEANSTRRAAARKAKQSLEDANVRLLGVVLNSRTFPIPETIYRRL
jgi:polysaccharide biosynthesis transport protein